MLKIFLFSLMLAVSTLTVAATSGVSDMNKLMNDARIQGVLISDTHLTVFTNKDLTVDDVCKIVDSNRQITVVGSVKHQGTCN